MSVPFPHDASKRTLIFGGGFVTSFVQIGFVSSLHWMINSIAGTASMTDFKFAT